MELPPWLKIENLIGSLNFTGWFRGWFVKQEFHQTISITINIPIKEELGLGTIESLGHSKPLSQKVEVKFTPDHARLVSKVNLVHQINNKNDYDFKEDYTWALYYIQHKPASDWPCNAAMRIAQAMQDIDFFSAFNGINDPDKKNKFDNLKTKINYLYNRIIQELRHTNKRGQIEKQFTAPYHTMLKKKPDVTNVNYEDVFNEFQNLLTELFNNFRLKE